MFEGNVPDVFFAVVGAGLCVFWMIFVTLSPKADQASFRIMCAMSGLFLGIFSLQSVWGLIDHTAYDDTTPFVVVESQRVITPVVRAGEVAVVEYEYNKRAGCEGSASYRMRRTDVPQAGGIILDSTMTGWPVGHGVARGYFNVPEGTKPGEYVVFWIVSGHCRATAEYSASSSRRPMRARSPFAKIEVQ